MFLVKQKVKAAQKAFIRKFVLVQTVFVYARLLLIFLSKETDKNVEASPHVKA